VPDDPLRATNKSKIEFQGALSHDPHFVSNMPGSQHDRHGRL
jgi:hypothetical protein